MNVSPSLNAAKNMLRERRFDWAAATFERLIREDSFDSGEAAYCLAIMHHTGSGVEKSIDEAAKYYLIASQHSHSMGAYRLAEIYQRRGKVQEAYSLYRAVADNVPSAAYWAYRLLLNDKNLDQDPKAIEKYLNSAAEQGHIKAKRVIAMRYLSGQNGIIKIPYGAALFCKMIFSGILTVIIKNQKMKYE
jgi:TPR repeat protein